MAGIKEAYGISIISNEYKIKIPPKAVHRYGLMEDDQAIMMTGHRGESGFGLIRKEPALNSVFKGKIKNLNKENDIYHEKGKAYGESLYQNGYIIVTPELLDAFYLKIHDKLMVVKSTTIAMSYTPIDIWKEKFKIRELDEAVTNMEKLEVFL